MTDINKAAEEGELLIALSVFDMGLGFALCHKDFGQMRSAVQKLNKDFAEIRSLIAADRASRQVANKAEVDLSSLPIAWYMKKVHLGWPEFNKNDEFSGGLTDGDKLVRLADVEALLATPPATTGASTVLTDEREKAFGEALNAIAGVLWELGNKIGMQDEVYGAERCQEAVRAAFRGSLVAAQAGQVAVLGLSRGYESGTCTNLDLGGTVILHYESPQEAEAAFEIITDSIDADKRNSVAAPSPAKESK